jgi:hypothetical protein
VTDWPALPVSPIEDFTNGIIYQALADAAPGIWFLSASENGHPVLYKTGDSNAIETVFQNVELQDDAIYDLQGRKISTASLRRGIYVSNGRKFIVK